MNEARGADEYRAGDDLIHRFRLAAREHISLSLKIRDLSKDPLEAREDIVLAAIAEERDRSFRRFRSLSHKQVWG